LEEPSPTYEEELLNSKFVLKESGSLLPFEVEVKKPLMEDYLDDLELPNDLDTTCYLLSPISRDN
jgi:hypothetical protein